MLSRLLRQLLFCFIHLVIDVLVAVQKFCQRFPPKKYIKSEEKAKKKEIKMILDHIPKMTKSLKHAMFHADMDKHTYEDLAHLVIWSLVAGIPFISFYDSTGELQDNEEKLFLEVERCKKGVPGCIKWARKPDLNGYTNGVQAHTVVVNIFSNNDGKQKIVQCIKDIAENKIDFVSKSSEFTAQELDKVLSTVYPAIPDPDVVLYTGLVCMTHGLLPWQIRLSEFIPLSIDHSISIDSFIGAMYRYNERNQRFGK